MVELIYEDDPSATISNGRAVINVMMDSFYFEACEILDTWADDAVHGVDTIQFHVDYPNEARPSRVTIYPNREFSDGVVFYTLREPLQLPSNMGQFVTGPQRHPFARQEVADLLEPKLVKYARDLKNGSLSVKQLKDIVHAVWVGSQLINLELREDYEAGVPQDFQLQNP